MDKDNVDEMDGIDLSAIVNRVVEQEARVHSAHIEQSINKLLEMNSLVGVLVDDASVASRRMFDEGTAESRRAYVRTLFAYIEGVSWAMMQYAIESGLVFGATFTDSERSFMNGQEPYLNSKGIIDEKSAKTETSATVRFAFDVYGRLSRGNHRLQTDGKGWDAFQKSLKVRHKLTHPKSPQEMEIDEGTMKTLLLTYTWFTENHSEITTQIQRTLSKIGAVDSELKTIAEELRTNFNYSTIDQIWAKYSIPRRVLCDLAVAQTSIEVEQALHKMAVILAENTSN